MDLLLVRHAIAAPAAPGMPDAERPLTDEGRSRWRRSVRGLAALGLRFDRLLHSPLLRAVQTADELVGLVDGETVVTPYLAEPPAESLLELLRGAERVAAIGHEPWLGEWASRLLGGRDRPPLALEIKKGGVVWLRGEPRDGGMALLALLPPRALTRLRRK